MKSDRYKELWSLFSNAQKIAFIILFVLCVLSGVLIPALLPVSTMRHVELSRNYRAGELSDEDVYSPVSVSFVDEYSTAQNREEAKEDVLPYYSFDYISTISRINSSRSYIEAVKENDADKAYEILRNVGLYDEDGTTHSLLNLSEEGRENLLNISHDMLEKVLRNGIFSFADLNIALSNGYDSITREKIGQNFNLETENIPITEAITLEGVYEYVINYCYDNLSLLNEEGIISVAKLVRLFAISNVSYDPVMTEDLRQKASNSTTPVSVRLQEGDLIIAKDTIITDQQLRIIDQINNRRIDVPFSSIIANAIFLFAILSFSLIYFALSIQYKYRVPLYTLLFLSGVLIVLVLSFFIISTMLVSHGRVEVDPILPFLFLPIVFACITNRRRIGFSVGLVCASYAVLFPTSTKYTFFFLIVVIEASVLFVRKGTTRIDVIYEALYSSLLAAFSSAVFSLLNGFRYDVMARNIMFVVVNVVLTYIAVSIALPILEKIFNLPTQFRLHELSYSDSPTLNRLNQVAQGTFNHVRNVSDMSYAAAKEIGADAELTRVGALYHDIGKAEHPEYFIENQGGKANAHDELNNNLSAAIIKSHVKLGVEKGREIGLPQEVLDIIGQHHGNDIITYFYNEAKKNSADGGRLVREEDFRYNGEIPQSPESAIVMLADCVEAASRTLKNPNTQKYDRLIMNIIISKINHGQMADSKLTLTDLMKIKDTFIRSLVGRDHQRIEYDKE